MGEGLAGVVVVGSVVLTTAAMVLATLAAGRPSRIRIGFDVGRTAIGVIAILVMALVTDVATALPLTILAIVAGSAFGFIQGSQLDVAAGARGLYARRSALGIALWGVGIVVMQTAGIASRLGVVRFGQTVAWFSVAIGVGLVAGRRGPMRDAVGAPAAAGVIALMALLGGSAIFVALRPAPSAASALRLDVVPENLCALLPPQVGEAELGAERRRDFTDCVAAYQLGEPSSDGQSPVHIFDVWVASPQWGDIDGLFADDQDDLSPGGPISIGDSGLAGVIEAETGPVEEYRITFRRGDLYVSIKNFEGPYEERPHLPKDATRATAEAIARAIDANIVALGDAPGATPVVPVPAPGTPPEVGSDASSESGAGTEDPSAQIDADAADPVATSPPIQDVSQRVTRIEPGDAAGQAIAGLIAAAAIGLISVAEAGELAASLFGRGRLGPGEAIGVINDLLSGRPFARSGVPPPAVSPPPPSTGASGTAGGAGGPGLSPAAVTRTVYVSGAEAEAVIQGGPGSTVAIPDDQQWDEDAAFGGERIQRGRVGSSGVVRSVGPVVRGADGSVSVAVEVDAFDPPPPPPPPTPQPQAPAPAAPPRAPGQPSSGLPPAPAPFPAPPPPPSPAPSPPASPTGPPPPGEPAAGGGDRFSPEEIDDAFDRGLDDLERLDLGGSSPAPGPSPGPGAVSPPEEVIDPETEPPAHDRPPPRGPGDKAEPQVVDEVDSDEWTDSESGIGTTG
ncbi:MAG: hypothetical protein ACE5GC_01355 [Acidimicrobiia bacterium]